MVGKVTERSLLREGHCLTIAIFREPNQKSDSVQTGLERTDNGMKLTSWPEVVPINQKNYYT
jgi:hypothetical protein